MTITIVCDILGEENNGTTIACMNLIRFLRAQGHTVRVVCADQDKAGNECFYVVPELNLYLLNPIVERNGVTLPRLDRSLLEDAIRDCDVVHTTFVLQLSHTAVKIAKAYNKPITSSFHCQAENVTAHFLCKDLDAINRGVYRACYQMVYQYSDIIHYPTQFIRDTFEAVVGPTNGRVISNGVNSMFTPGPAKRPAGLEGKFLIVSTGRLSSEKNQEILIEAIGRSAHREQIHLNFGYESYNDYGDLGMDDFMLDSQLLRGYDQIVSDEPFFSFIITYSGHGPYTTEQQNISEPHLDRARAVIDYSTVPYTTEAQKEEYTRAVAQAMETDAFIGGLRERLEADGHAEDTVLVLFTDHYCKYFSDTELIEAIKGTTDHNLLSNVPFVIWTEGITPQVSEKYVSTMDIAPTIVDLFSLDADPTYYIGSDMFGPDGGVVYFRNYAWYDGKTYDTGNDASTNPAVLAMREQVHEQIDISQDTFRCNYFAYLQKRSGETETK